MPVSVHRKGRGVKYVASVTIPSATGVTQAGDVIHVGSAGFIDIVDRIYFQYPTDVSAWDMDLQVNGIMEAGSARTVFTIDEAGATGPTDLAAVFDWDNPNPPTNKVYGYVELPNLVLDGASDDVQIVGNDATAGNNYTSAGAVAITVSVVYRRLTKAEYERNLV
jgi:hypothetical protein